MNSIHFFLVFLSQYLLNMTYSWIYFSQFELYAGLIMVYIAV